MASTYTPIATTTLGSAASNITFSSIPGTYTDLVLVINGAGASGLVGMQMQFNGDTATNYSYTRLQGNGTTASSARESNGDGGIGYLAQDSMTTIINVMNYANSTTYKTSISRTNSNYSSDGRTGSYVHLWRSTAAITSIKLTGSQNFNSGTMATLYGIAAA